MTKYFDASGNEHYYLKVQLEKFAPVSENLVSFYTTEDFIDLDKHAVESLVVHLTCILNNWDG